ncbi:ferric-dicitrate binding protein FerR (iron transport regulator) [Pedobacter cryoconitis]|uniref:Ferric-dicitrate binding protein FerR (Iron transport regulator) n=1 Tax=Pedobacter cryoconitis TaxID=188932 RepID=A0A7W9DWY2_9SPHI|nr:FecR domain-containing protein [Pedobacter cryoconitis]MBB5634537.1 ferric-dicitrate binding protein FerR (iron transport regulator) [Pedobacter cryoconitis]MBB6272338.1 ferric-dicitrate binding protein FerR (iron transport regulator) [Pedobacter cryoconitis]
MKQSVDFSSYKLEDYIDDPKFISWVTLPDDALDLFWKQVQEDYPQTKSLISEARNIVLSITIQTENMSLQEQGALWKTIELKAGLHQKKQSRTISLWLRAAAAVLLIGTISILSLFYYSKYQKLEISTSYGQVRSIALPDGTIVTLNANSKLEYAKNWDKTKLREVWIEGEGFFKVNHLHRSGKIKEAERFVVHAEKLNVEVLGTSFNVNNRRGLVKVALLTGKVRLEVKDDEKSPVNLQPGELGEYQEGQTSLIKMKVYAKDYASWKNGELHFDNTPLTKVLLLIEDNYGYKAILKDPAIGNKKLSGTFSFSTEDALFKAIAVSLGVSIEKDSNKHQLIIK